MFYRPPPDDDKGPSEEELYRQQQAQEEWDQAAIERLLEDLSEKDVTRELFTFAEIKTFGLRRRRKYD